MFITVDTSPQVLFAVHLYSPAWDLLMLEMFSGFSLLCSPVLTFVHITVGSGMPAVTLQYTSTLSPSVKFLILVCSTDAWTERDNQNVHVKDIIAYVTSATLWAAYVTWIASSMKYFLKHRVNKYNLCKECGESTQVMCVEEDSKQMFTSC